MHFKTLAAPTVAAIAIVGCGEAVNNGANAQSSATAEEASATQSEAVSGEYAPDPKHRYITFSYLHQGFSRPMVRWRDWTGTLNWDAENPENSSVSVTIDASSVDSGVDEFDGHLRDERFFDTANHPEITFQSTSVSRTGDSTGTIAGDLTIKGETKPVTLDVTFNKGAFNERDNSYKLGFSGSTTVKRSDFGVDTYVPYVSDEVDITIETEWVMQADSEG